LQGLVYKYRPESICIMVDFHHQLCRSYMYLKQQYPDANHVFPSQVDDFFSTERQAHGSFVYLPVQRFDLISSRQAALVSNFFSLGEMRREFFTSYWQSPLFKNAKCQYLVNRFISAPYFEPTYDSDITVADYLNGAREKQYFDVFPMHHFLQIKRKLFGRKVPRNTSSSYFELVTTSS